MAELTEEVLEDGSIRLTLRDGTRTASCTVSSFHLVAEKRRRLEEALQPKQLS